MANNAKTAVLMAGLLGLFLVLGQLLGGTQGMFLALPLAQVNPLAAHGGGLLSLFSTHPATARRVAALLALPAAG